MMTSLLTHDTRYIFVIHDQVFARTNSKLSTCEDPKLKLHELFETVILAVQPRFIMQPSQHNVARKHPYPRSLDNSLAVLV